MEVVTPTLRITVTVSDALFESLTAVGLTVLWCTSWLRDGDLDAFIDQTGAGRHGCMQNGRRVEYPRDVPVAPLDWKARAVERFLESQSPLRPVIWIDDDSPWSDGRGIDWGRRPHLLMAPEPMTGLTPEHLETIRAQVAHWDAMTRP